jgi:hypothetical protein
MFSNRLKLPETKEPTIAYSGSKKQFFVQGTTFDADDADAALRSEQLLGGVPTGLPEGDWIPLTTQQYGQLLQSIRQPGLGTLASKGFGRGVDISQMLVGRGLQLAGAEELGGRIVAQQMEDLRKTQPYERQFTDVKSGGDAVDWLVANFAQQGPNLIESIVTAGLGFLAGTASSGNPLGGAAASLASVIGKETWKNSVKDALKKRAAGEALTPDAEKLLRTAAGVGMATAVTFGQGMATGAADIYGELRERGADADDVTARMTALKGSVPYALLDILPEAVLFSRLLGRGARPALGTLPTARAKALEVAQRGLVGGAVGGAAGGTSELGQEALLLYMSDQELGSPENVKRLINSFAAGAAVSGPIGAGVNIFNPSNLLQPGTSTDPTGTQQPVTPTLPASAPRGTQGELFPIAPGEMAGPAFSPLPPRPAPGVVPAQPGQMALFEPTAPTVASRMERGMMPPGPMAQGQLALVGGQVAPGYVPPQAFAPEVPAVPGLSSQEAAAQGALQFAPPAPEGRPVGTMANQLQAIVDRQRRERELAAIEAQQAAQREADLERLAVQATNQRLLEQAGLAEAPAPAPALPMVPITPRQPQQLPLFTRRQAPVPPKAGQLRRGRKMQPAPAAQPDRGIRQATLQLPMFTATGEPSLPALKAAGTRKKVAAAPAPTPAKNTAGARGLKKGAKVAEINVAEAERPEVATQRATLERLLPKETGNLKLEKITAYAGNWRVSYITADGRSGNSMPVNAEDLVGKTDAEIKVMLADRARKNGLKEVADAIETRNLKQGRVAKRAEDRTGVGAGGNAGQQPPTQEQGAGRPAGGRGVALKRGKKAEVAPTAKVIPLKRKETAPTPATVETLVRFRWTDGTRGAYVVLSNGKVVELYAFDTNTWTSPAVAEDVTLGTTLQEAAQEVASREGTAQEVPAVSEARKTELLKEKPKTRKELTFEERRTMQLDEEEDAAEAVPPKKEPPPPKGEAAVTPPAPAPGEGFLDSTKYVYHVVRSDADIPGIMKSGLRPGSNVSFDTDGQAFSGEGDTILVFLREAVSPDTKEYQGDGVTTKAAKPVAILKDTSVEAGGGTKQDLEEQAATAQEEFDKLVEYSQREYGLSQGDVEAYAWGTKKITAAPAEAQPLMKRLRALSARVDRLLEESERAPDTAVSAETVLAKYTQYDVPVQQVVIEAQDDGQLVTLGVKAPTRTISAEDQWNEERLPGDVAFVDLPKSAKDRWEASDRSGAAQVVILQEVGDQLLPMTPTERLNYAIAAASAAMDAANIDGFTNTIDTIVEVAYFTPGDDYTKAQQAEALQFLSDPDDFNGAEQQAIQDSFVVAAEGKTLETTTKKTKTGTGEAGAYRPWYSYALDTPGMIQRLSTVNVVFSSIPEAEARRLLSDGLITRANLPVSTANRILGKEVTAKEDSEANPQRSPLFYLLEEITKLNSSTAPLNAKAQKAAIERLRAYYAAALEQDLDTAQVDQYFRTDGTPITAKIDDLFRVLNEEDYNNRGALEAASRAERKAADAAKRGPTISTFDDWEEDGRFFSDDNVPLKPMGAGRIRMAVTKFLSKLKIKPTVHVFRNQEDLKASNPELYRRAVAARPQGDFDLTPAAGYSFGQDQVIIFSDRIRTERHLNFVLAHETLGHFGLRSILPKDKFNAVMEDIYNRSDNVRLAVDAAMDVRDMPKAEAVEEYLADFAANLDVSLIARVWNAIKDALNALGIRFGDEAARFWVSQARRYVRTGQTSSLFTVQDVMARVQAVETADDPDNTGRFVVAGDLRMDNIRAADLMQDVATGFSNITEATKSLKGVLGNTQESVDKFLAQVFSLMNFRARENAGAYEVDRVLRRGRGIAMEVRNALNEKLAPMLSRAVEVPFSKITFGGITEVQYEQANRLLYAAQRLKFSTIPTPSELGRTPLYRVNPDTGELIPNQTEIDRLYNMGLITLEQARDGFTYKDTYMDAGEEKTETVRVAGIPGLTKDSPEWKAYIVTREAMRDVELELLRARYLSFTQERDFAFREIGEVTQNGKLTTAERKFFSDAYRRYKEFWTENPIIDEKNRVSPNQKSMEKANEFLAAFNKALIAEQKEATDAVAKERNDKLRAFLEGPADDFILSLEAFKDRLVRSEENKFIVQNRMKDLIASDVSNDGADVAIRRNLAGGYTPILRRGGFQLRIAATVGGKTVRLKQDYKDQLVYSQFETRDEAVELSKRINAALFQEGGQPKTYKVEAFNEETMQYELMDVQLTAIPGTALDGIAAPPELNLNEFIRGLRHFSIALPPKKLEQVIVALTAQNDRARQRLERNFVPGGSTDAGRAVAEHIEARASTIAKIIMRPKLAELTNLNMRSTRSLWYGDENRLRLLKEAVEQATPESRGAAQREYEFYAYQYNKTNPMVKGVRVERGAQYFNEAASALQFLEQNRNVDESDFASGKVASQVRAATSYMQLGGSVATGALNYIGALTNSLAYMATYNPKTAFGGGLGLGKSVAEFSRALNQVGLRRAVGARLGREEDLNTAEFYTRVAASPELQKRYGLTKDEAEFLAFEIREGEMVPALSNATTNTARGRVSSGAAQKFLDGWMWTFNSTEQAVRRAVGLAMYRMEFARARGAGLADADARKLAQESAVNALRFTLGDYSVLNRPPMWRSGVLSFVYIYKTFPTMSIQLFKRLPWKGRMYMLAALFVLGGITAFPFAEDIEDLIDTIAQGLGLKQASVRYEIAKVLDELAPGVSPYVLRGFANAYFPGNTADRISLGNFLPGTGVLLAGANISKEVTDMAGPAVSMLLGTASTMVDVVRAPFTERVSWVDILRESPVTMLRAFGDSVAYTQSGAIVDKRGYVVSEDLGVSTLAVRLLGFYPAAATEQYDVIRVAKRMTDYQKEVVAGFRQAWIKAKIQGDEDQAQQVVDSVNAWNEGARGTALEIRNFLPNATKALREAQRPAGERFLKSAPRAAREDIETVADLLGY